MKPLLQRIVIETVIGTCMSNIYLTGEIQSLVRNEEEYLLTVRFKSSRYVKVILKEYLSLGVKIESHSNVDITFSFPLSTTPSLTIISL